MQLQSSVIYRHFCCFLVACLSIYFCSCSKQIDAGTPPTSISSSTVFSDDATAAAVLTGIYTRMSSANFNDGSFLSLSLLPALSADELDIIQTGTDAIYRAYYTNTLTSTNIAGSEYWLRIYPIIYVANSAIEGITKSTGLSASVKQQLLGEAKFVRAFCYFYLVNLYGNVPLALSSEYTENNVLTRAPQADVWKQIVADLQDASSLLSANFLSANVTARTDERVRPTKWAAKALLARSYLYTGNWSGAATEATDVINHTELFEMVPLNEVFLKNSRAAIWQLQPVLANQNTTDAKNFLLPSSGPSASGNPFYLSDRLIDDFEADDLRKVNWVDSIVTADDVYYFPVKYKESLIEPASPPTPPSEYKMVFRLAELYLIRAEARAQLSNIDEAATDLNVVRGRAGLAGTAADDKDDMLNAILHERNVEFFTEWGQRWFDLKRTGNIGEVMANVSLEKGGSWNDNKQWYPIPLAEIQTNRNLTQNTGY